MNAGKAITDALDRQRQRDEDLLAFEQLGLRPLAEAFGATARSILECSRAYRRIPWRLRTRIRYLAWRQQWRTR